MTKLATSLPTPRRKPETLICRDGFFINKLKIVNLTLRNTNLVLTINIKNYMMLTH